MTAFANETVNDNETAAGDSSSTAAGESASTTLGETPSTTSGDSIDKRKAFVGGLLPDTTEDDLKTYFSQFGPVQHAMVKRDPTSGLSRCFAFVTFADISGLTKMATVAVHTLQGKKIDPKPADPRPGEETVLKVFVGGLDTAMEEEALREYFEKFGKVTNVEWPKDRLHDGAKKNFAFVEFEDGKVVDQLVKTPKQTIGSRLVGQGLQNVCDVKKALPAAAKRAIRYGADPYGSPYGSYPYQGYGADPSAYGGYYGGGYGGSYGQTGYGDPSGYGGAGAPAYDPYGPPAPGYGAFRGRGAVRPNFGAAGARGSGFHPYRR